MKEKTTAIFGIVHMSYRQWLNYADLEQCDKAINGGKNITVLRRAVGQ